MAGADLPRSHWYLQGETIRGEGTWVSLEGLTRAEKAIYDETDLVLDAIGRGARSTVAKAARALHALLVERGV